MASGEDVRVLYVHKKNAKFVKTKLEQEGLLNKDFRLSPSPNGALYSDCVAAPLLVKDEEEATSKIQLMFPQGTVLGFGCQFCPYSTALLGNHNHVRKTQRRHQNNDGATKSEQCKKMSLVQHALVNAFSMFLEMKLNLADSSATREQILQKVEEKMQSLDLTTCPKTLQYLGDDKTLVIPLRAFDIDRDESFRDFIISGISVSEALSVENNSHFGKGKRFVEEFVWESLASSFKSPRVVRRGEVHPDSKIRLSEYKILWPPSRDENGLLSGPDSPGWITVTEQGIRQSFDLTRVMFSRGNITEKIRFGELVQPGEIVLDLYAGIGYFSLPALVHGGAEFLYACEWNEEAVRALKFNLEDNGVHYRAKVLVGDCREQAAKHNLVDLVDRVSLGLIPSSEGGWRTAVKALRRVTGGWLHIHGNVPVNEVDHWTRWVCIRIMSLVQEEQVTGNQKQWCVLVSHVEKVKSFAPTVNHYVADIFAGPQEQLQQDSLSSLVREAARKMVPGSAGVLWGNGEVEICGEEVSPPSCALSEDGVLHQEWMREKTS